MLTDKGKEFYNTTLARWLDQQGIHHYSMQGDGKASVVEQFNRMLKRHMYRYFMAKGMQDYLSVLHALVDGYDNSRHGSISMAPKDVTSQNEKKVWQPLYGSKLDKKSS